MHSHSYLYYNLLKILRKAFLLRLLFFAVCWQLERRHKSTNCTTNNFMCLLFSHFIVVVVAWLLQLKPDSNLASASETRCMTADWHNVRCKFASIAPAWWAIMKLMMMMTMMLLLLCVVIASVASAECQAFDSAPKCSLWRSSCLCAANDPMCSSSLIFIFVQALYCGYVILGKIHIYIFGIDY